jgi:hypothetical protein
MCNLYSMARSRDEVTMGGKPKLTPHQRGQGLARRETGEPMWDIAHIYNVSHSSTSRLTP